MENAFSLHFDGTYERNFGQASARIIINNTLGNQLSQQGMLLLKDKSNNEAEYWALIKGLEINLSRDFKHLCVYGDEMLIVE